MQNFLTDEQIEKAVNWWKKVLINPKFSAHSEEERASGQDNLAMAELMAKTFLTNGNSDKHAVDQFCIELQKLLKESEYSKFGLHVDYDPCQILNDAAKKSGFKGRFPWKTNMYFRHGEVQVSYGYGAKVETI